MNTVKIGLSTGGVALVDEQDAPRVRIYRWRRSSHGYAVRQRRVNGKRVTIYMHRVILDAPDGMDVDHANRDGLDNRRENLRACTRSQNIANAKPQKGTSRFKGVSRYEGGWQAAIRVRRRKIYLGRFHDEEVAARAYDAAAREHFGEFARPNFPEA